jgi:DNA-binding transcriptional LysR family regulator
LVAWAPREAVVVLDVHRLRLLCELDRRGTLAAVARALSYSPSAVSQQLSQLEAETGVPLLEPSGRGVRLTAQARILVAHGAAILERLEQAEADLRASLTEVRGTLRVASFQSVLLALIPAVLTTLAEQHPGLRVEITHQEAGPALAGLLAHEFDLVLGEEYPGTARPRVAGARTQPLVLDELFVAIPARGPHARAAEPGPVELAELAEVPWILDPADTGPGLWARNACREAGFEPDVRYGGCDLLLQLHLVETGHAAAVLPGLLLAAAPLSAARIRAIAGHPHRQLTTGVRSGAAGDPAIRAFRAALRQAAMAASPLPQAAQQPARAAAPGPGRLAFRSQPSRSPAIEPPGDA